MVFENIKYEGLITYVIDNIKSKKKMNMKRDKYENKEKFLEKTNSFINSII